MKTKSDPGDPEKKAAISRRSFIKGAGAVAAAAGLFHPRRADTAEPPLPEGVAEKLGPGAQAIELNINGETKRLTIEPRVTLLRALREDLGLTGTKLACD
ncbi:MAG TPA: twin-arginine translocation signal domain-containing protein, partial [Candidatus Binataceae bacterium]